MAESFLTMKEFEKLFWRLTTLMLGFDPAKPEHAGKVRISWPRNGSPAWKITDDVTFIRVGEEDDKYNVIRDTLYQSPNDDSLQRTDAYTRVIRVHWLFYGPNSYNNAFRVRNALFDEQYREVLSNKRIYLIPVVDTPNRAPELFGGQYWERTDMSARFNELVSTVNDVPFLKSADITVKSSPESGITLNKDASVNPNIKIHGGV